MEGFVGGFQIGQDLANQAMEQKIKGRELSIKMQDQEDKRQQMAQKLREDAYNRILQQTDTLGQQFVQSIGTNFQEGTPAASMLDKAKEARAQALKSMGMDPDLADGWATAIRAAMKQPKLQTAQPGTAILQIGPDGSVKPQYVVPPTPSELQRSAEFAAGGDAEQARGLVKGALESRGGPAYTAGTPVIDDKGNYAGSLTTDRRTGKPVFQGLDGTIGDMPEGYRPTTNSGLSQGTANFTNFNKLATEANQIERSVTQISKYMQNVNDTEQGWRLLADQWRAKAKTAIGGDLSPKEIETLAQNGRLQGLLGQFREDVVGGGVMTEQDAQRVLQALGGDATWTRNRQVVANLLKDIVQNRVADYNSRVQPQFNEQLKTAKRGDLKPKEPLTVDQKLFSGGDAATSRAGNAPAQSKGQRPGENLPTVKSAADYEKLDAGTVYLDPKGIRRIKGGG